MKKFRLYAVVGLALGALASVFATPAVAFQPSASDSLPAILLGGMIINKETLSAAFTGLKTVFNNALKAAPGNWQLTAMEVPSDAAGEDYAWLSRFPKFRKWIGSKVVKNIAAGKYYVANEDWETTIGVKKNDLADDRLGIYKTQTQQAGESASELQDNIVDDLKNNAFTKLCFDGQYFYDTDHAVNGASVSNKLTVALSNATRAAADASFGAAYLAITNFKDEEGQPLRLIPDTLEVPPALMATAKLLMENEKLQDDTPNPYRGMAKVLVNPALSSATQWMLHVTSKTSVKPFIVQMRQRPEFVQQTNLDSDEAFDTGLFKYGAEARATGLYGYWQLSVGSTG